jgi:hypothetical protein
MIDKQRMNVDLRFREHRLACAAAPCAIVRSNQTKVSPGQQEHRDEYEIQTIFFPNCKYIAGTTSGQSHDV